MSGDDLRSSVREQRAGKALRHGMKGQALRNKIRGTGITNAAGGGTGGLAQRVQRGKTFRLRVERRAGKELNDGTRETSDAGGGRRRGKGNSARRQSGQRSGEENPA